MNFRDGIHATMRSRTIDEYMQRPGWTPIENSRHRARLTLSFKDAGGGGDCLFHSIAAALNDVEDERPDGLRLHPSDFIGMRESAASAVVPENAADVLMDMAAQFPRTPSDPMDIAPATHHAQFAPEIAWNEAKGDPMVMVDSLRRAISTMGNFFWGDATTAALLEISEDVNIIMLSADTGGRDDDETRCRATGREISMARSIFRGWVDMAIDRDVSLRGMDAAEVVSHMAKTMGFTWDGALRIAHANVRGQGRWLKGRRQPIGTVRVLCSDPRSGDLGRVGYSDARPTIVVWNISNAHWVPIGVGPRSLTLIPADSPLRRHVDELLG
jgi:hypothetical protein